MKQFSLILAAVMAFAAQSASASTVPTAETVSSEGWTDSVMLMKAEDRAASLIDGKNAELQAASYTIVAGNNKVQRVGSRLIVDFKIIEGSTMRGKIEIDLARPGSLQFTQYSDVIKGSPVTYTKAQQPGSWLPFALLAQAELAETQAAASNPAHKAKLQKSLDRLAEVLDKRYVVETVMQDGSKIETARYGNLVRVTAQKDAGYYGGFYTLNLSSGILSIGGAQYNNNVRITPAYRNKMAFEMRNALRRETNTRDRENIKKALAAIGR